MGATSKFEVRIRKFGRIISRHVDATSQEQACDKCEGKGIVVLGVRKVDAQDVIGRADTFKLVKEIVGKIPNTPEWQNQNQGRNKRLINEDTTIDSLIFGNRSNSRDKDKDKGSENYNKNRKIEKIDNRIIKDELN